ncbi:MAG: hypothetical protein AB7R89_08745 [Dehalococcoidia bacterium]
MVTTPTSKQSLPGRDYGLIALVILFAVVIGAVVTWYLASDGDDTTTTTEVAPASLPAPASAGAATEAEAPARGGLAETWDAQAASRASLPTNVYIVSSEDEANRLHATLAEAESVANGMGLPLYEYRVVVLPAEADPYPMFAEEQNVRNAEGLPGLTVHDMRFQPAETPDVAQAPVVIEEPPAPIIENFTPYNIGP